MKITRTYSQNGVWLKVCYQTDCYGVTVTQLITHTHTYDVLVYCSEYKNPIVVYGNSTVSKLDAFKKARRSLREKIFDRL